MGFGSYWPLAFLIFIPVIILLYLLKQKAEDHPFSSLFLWREAYKNIEASTPWERLKNNLLMYLQILTVLLLIGALMAPYLKNSGNDAANCILVVDASASMNSSDDGKVTCFDQAITNACNYVDSLKDQTAMTVISMDRKTTMVIAQATDKEAVKKAIRSITLTDTAGDADQAVDFISAFTAQLEAYDIVVFTDAQLETSMTNLHYVLSESTRPNASVDYVRHAFNGDELTVLAKLTNHSADTIQSDLSLYLDDQLIDVTNVLLEPMASQVVYFTPNQYDGNVLKVKLENHDRLDKDNSAYDLLKASSDQKVLLVTEQNIFLEKALQSISGIELYKMTDPAYLDEDELYDIYIFDGIFPETLPKTGSILWINPDTDNEWCTIEEELKNVWVYTQAGAVTAYIDPYALGVSSVKGMKNPVWAESFMTSGDYSAGYIGDYQGRTVAVLGFDLHDSDFVLQTEYPVFINNLLNQCIAWGLVSQDHGLCGESLLMNINPNGSEVTITKPDQQQEVLSPTSAQRTYDGVTLAGVYALSQIVDGVPTKNMYIADFPVDTESGVQESALSFETDGQNEPVLTTANGRNLRAIIIVACLFLLAAEWIIYLRRL